MNRIDELARFGRVAVALVVICIVIPASPATGAQESVAAEVGRDPLVAVAFGAPAEHGAHLLLSLVEAGRVKGKDKIRFVLDAAIAKSDEAAEPYRVRLVSGLSVNSLEGCRSSALYQFPVDRISLRCRAVRLLLDIAPADATALLERTPEDLGLEQSKCEDALVPEVDRFYETLAAVVARGFSKAERERSLDVALARRYVAGIRSGAQVEPAMRFVVNVDVAPEARIVLVDDLASALRAISPSHRLFALAFGYEDGLTLPGRALATAREVGLEKRFTQAFRDYAVRSLSARRCGPPIPGGAGLVPEFVATLNETVFHERPITAEDFDVAPATGEAPAPHYYWRSPRSIEVLTAFQEMRMEREAMNAGTSTTTEIAWRQRFDRYLDLLRAWKVDDEASPETYVIQRCEIYTGLYKVAPDDAARRDTTAAFLTFLKQYDLGGESRIVWLDFAGSYALQIRADARARLLDAYEASGDATLAAYATVQKSGINVLNITDPPEE